jgi:hypothetical protein
MPPRDHAQEVGIVRAALVAAHEETTDAIRERYQIENSEIRGLLGRLRRAMREAIEAHPSPDSVSILHEALSLPIPGPWKPI